MKNKKMLFLAGVMALLCVIDIALFVATHNPVQLIVGILMGILALVTWIRNS